MHKDKKRSVYVQYFFCFKGKLEKKQTYVLSCCEDLLCDFCGNRNARLANQSPEQAAHSAQVLKIKHTFSLVGV